VTRPETAQEDNQLDYAEKAREVIGLEIEGLEKVRSALNESFGAAVDLMLAALGNGGKIVVTGIGKNLHIADKISATLASTGATSVVLNPTQAMHGDLGILDPPDVLLVLSYTGESDELLALLPLVKRAGLEVVAFTGVTDSSIAKASDVVVATTVDREACPFNMAPTVSTTAALAVGDALAMVLLEARGVDKEDFARFHPAGAIGRALLVRVSDIMRAGDRLVNVTKDLPVKDVLTAMTGARSGSAAIVDSDGRVVGIFTDGDLRRHIATTPDLLELAVDKVMTPNPVVVQADMLAADVLRVYEELKIDDLLVVDADGKLVGAIDIQDLPKVKVM